MSEIYVQSCSTGNSAFEAAEYLKQRGFEVTTYGPIETVTVDSTSMNEGSFAADTNEFIVVATK